MSCLQENVAPNFVHLNVERNVERKKPTRRVKKSARAAAAPTSSIAAAAAAGDVGAAGIGAAAATTGAPAASATAGPRPRSDSPRVRKHQKLSEGEAAILAHCLGLRPEANWKTVSPPFLRVQERHGAFACHAKAVQARGPSNLQAIAVAPHDTVEFERLARSVACCDLNSIR